MAAPDVELATIGDHVGKVGLTQLRREQGEAVIGVLAGRDVVAVLPTGAGKSAIYQVLGSMVPGITVVVSPLLALHEDQVRSIEDSELPDAVRLDGSTSGDDRAAAFERARNGTLEFLFVTPESLVSFVDGGAFDDVDVSLLVIDEAHCIVTWGNGFRPAYLTLGEARRTLGSPSTLALTASADPRMRADIAAVLGLDDPMEVVTSIVRPSIAIELDVVDDHRRAFERVVDAATAAHGRTIVYVPTRALADEVRGAAADTGRPSVAYHGGLDRAARTAALDRIRTDDEIVVAATTAFGMGIDLPDVRMVIHLDLPPSLIDYYQEIGRAGRDGEPASAIGVVTGTAASRRAFTSGVSETDLDVCVRAHQALLDGATSRRAVAAAVDVPVGRVHRALSILAEAGAATLQPSLEAIEVDLDVEQLARTMTRREEFHRSQRAAVDRYVAGAGCRWQQIAAALGDAADPCGTCDHCLRSDPAASSANADERVGRRVDHAQFGAGTIASIDDDVATVLFDDGGPKVISLPHVEDEIMRIL